MTTTTLPSRHFKALFVELNYSNPDHIKFTLKDNDYKGYPSLRRLYLETADITEYDFATKYFTSYHHWEELTKRSWFKPLITAWRKELEIKLKAKALRKLETIADSPTNQNSFQANKYLLDKGYQSQEKHPRGRPSKQEIAQAAHSLASEDRRLEEDLELIKNLN